MTPEEMDSLSIPDSHECANDKEERPKRVTTLGVTEAQSDEDLQRQTRIDALPATLKAACEEVKRLTGLNSFVIYGGPSPHGSGGYRIWQYVFQGGRVDNHFLTPPPPQRRGWAFNNER